MDRSRLELVRSKEQVLARSKELELVRSKELHRNRSASACGRTCATNHHGTLVHMGRKHRKQVLVRSKLAHNMNHNHDRNRRTNRLVRWHRSSKLRKRQPKLKE
jgi:hypothetical protein